MAGTSKKTQKKEARADEATDAAKKCTAKCVKHARGFAETTTAQDKFDCTNQMAMQNYSDSLAFCASHACKKEMDTHRKHNQAWARQISSKIGSKPKQQKKRQQQQQQQQQLGGGGNMYEFEVRGSPAFSELEVTLGADQAIIADGGALAYMREGVERGTLKLGNVGAALGRFLGGESLLLNKYVGKAATDKASRRVTFACSYPGDMLHLPMQAGETYTVSRGSFLAASPTVKISGRLNVRGIFEIGQEEGLVLPKITCEGGEGCVWLAAYGSFRRHELAAGESMLVDNGLFLACSGRTLYTVTKLGKSWTSTILGGEGLGMKFKGPCTLYTQSHNFNDLVGKIASKLPDKK